MYACAYNINNLYNTRQSDLPDMVRIVYINFMHALYMHMKIKFFNDNIIALSVDIHLRIVM